MIMCVLAVIGIVFRDLIAYRNIDLYSSNKIRNQVRHTCSCSLIVAYSFYSHTQSRRRDNVTADIAEFSETKKERTWLVKMWSDDLWTMQREIEESSTFGLCSRSQLASFEHSRGSYAKWVNTRSHCLLQNARAFRFACAVCKRSR